MFIIYAARYLGASGYGRYSFVIVFISYFSFLSEFGLDWVIIRDVATDKTKVKTYMSGAILLRGCLSILAIALAWGSIFVLKKPTLLPLLLIASGSLITSSLTGIFNSAFQAFERMQYIAFIDIPYSVFRPALSIFVLASGGNLKALLICQLIVDVLRTLVGSILYLTKIANISICSDSALLKLLIKSSLPLMLWKLFTLAEQRINFLLLAFIAGEMAVGWYAAPLKLIDLVGLLILAAADALLPLLSRLFVDSKERFLQVVDDTLRYIMIIFFPIALGTFVLARPIILLLFGNQYVNSIQIFQYLAWLIFLLPSRFLLSTMLLAMRDWKVGAIMQAFAAIMAITSGMILISVNKHVGAAQAFLLTEIIITITLAVYLRSKISWQPIQTALKAWPKLLTLWTVFGFFLYMFKTVNLVFLIPSCILGYVAGVFFLRLITSKEVSNVKRLLLQRSGNPTKV